MAAGMEPMTAMECRRLLLEAAQLIEVELAQDGRAQVQDLLPRRSVKTTVCELLYQKYSMSQADASKTTTTAAASDTRARPEPNAAATSSSSSKGPASSSTDEKGSVATSKRQQFKEKHGYAKPRSHNVTEKRFFFRRSMALCAPASKKNLSRRSWGVSKQLWDFQH